MDIEEVLSIWTPARLSEVLGTSVQNVCGWMKEERIPLGRQYELQVKSGGKLLASNYDPDRDYVADGLRRGKRRA